MSRLSEALTWERSRAAGHDLLVLVKIADLTDDDGRNAWPEVPYLMEKCRMKERRTQYTLRRLRANGEIDIDMNTEGREITLRGGRKFRPKWFIHVLCVCAWTEYQQGWKPAKIAVFEKGRPKRKTAESADSEKLENRKNRHDKPQIRAEKTAESSSAYKEGSFKDLVVEQEQVEQAAAPPVSTPNPDENLSVITVLAHGLFDVLGLPKDHEFSEYADALKDRCVNNHIAYDSTVVRKALDSALWQRRHPTRRQA